MHTIAICISTFLLLLPTGATETDQPPYNPTDSFLLNCGSSSNQTYYNDQGRLWESDSHSQHFSSQNIQSSSSESNASEQDYNSAPKVPYKTARIFHSKFTYSFHLLSPGPKFVRLYFYSATYSGLNKSDSFFSVTADNFILLNNFSASLFASSRTSPYFVKEFIISVANNHNQFNLFELAFNPSPNSYAFINGIEIVSMPENLYTAPTDKPITFVNSKETPFLFTNGTALENVYRLNVGGRAVLSINDTGMLRTWIQDLNYLYSYKAGSTPYLSNVTIEYNSNTPAYTAPEVVYTTFRQMDPKGLNNTKYNLTWLFPLDAGFSYLVRLHFCETLLEVTVENQRVFSIYMNSMIAEEQMDVIYYSRGSKIPVYRDYIVFVEKESHNQEGYLLLELHPNNRSKPEYYNAMLNGVEIFKLNQSNGNLAGPNPDPANSVTVSQPKPWPKGNKKKSSILEVTIICIAVFSFVLGLFVCWLIFFYKRIIISSKKRRKEGSSLPSDLCRHFTINEIKAATCDFDERLIIGVGGFGNVYRGRLAGPNQIHVAVKRLNPRSKQGAREFRTEIEMLSKLRHVHLVSLIGYCDDRNEMILVYEYMSRGTLRDHLYSGPTENPALPWKQRLQICVEAARGLHYLHTGANHVIIHRDVKSTNILLDEKWVAKVSDFGLSRMGPTSALDTHVSTEVKGSFGYLDPEYCRRHQLTEKSDVYSFGVVLLEMLCGRPAMGRALPKEQVGLANWAQKCYKNGLIEQIVDPNLEGEIAAVCLKKFAEIAVRCVADDGILRPSMADVVGGLEFVMELQESDEKVDEFVGFEMADGKDRRLFGSRESHDEESDSGKGKSSEENSTETSVFRWEESEESDVWFRTLLVGELG
ncbi:Receptor-like protein kinase FERONIA [Morus notabilis]|uniref:Receptor-like protein kinase FERONIA n=1 Tax=Morus notabilis TaxID=981085 RepID=W9RYH0_9ROSA|nr:receptor-like protein kinase FERONIA [Morus notabilis]EXB77668.1 Receptor-like protein kinase FERONIA [Morus notabilis]